MPFVPAVDTVRLAINYISETLEVGTNVLHFQNTANGVSTPTVADLLTAVKAWQTAEWADVASEDWQTDYYEVRDMTQQEGLVVQDIETIPGTLTSPSLPAQNTIAISLRTGLAGRSRRGRLYHIGIGETNAIGSRVSVAYATNLAAAYTALIATTAAVDWRWVVASYVSDGAPRTTALLTPITNCILVDTIIDSMDTRKPRAGG